MFDVVAGALLLLYALVALAVAREWATSVLEAARSGSSATPELWPQS